METDLRVGRASTLQDSGGAMTYDEIVDLLRGYIEGSPRRYAQAVELLTALRTDDPLMLSLVVLWLGAQTATGFAGDFYQALTVKFQET